MCDYCHFGYLKNISTTQSGGSNPDLINHPSHYEQGGVDTREFIDAKELTYLEGNVVKYIVRARFKGDYVGDLKKAKNYIEYMIKKVEKSGGKR